MLQKNIHAHPHTLPYIVYMHVCVYVCVCVGVAGVRVCERVASCKGAENIDTQSVEDKPEGESVREGTE